MTSKNDITGDSIASKKSTDDYRDGWDRIFGQHKKVQTNDDNSANNADKSDHKQDVTPAPSR